jgi:hypothetical protein
VAGAALDVLSLLVGDLEVLHGLLALFLLLVLALFFHVHSFLVHMKFLSFAGMMHRVDAFYPVMTTNTLETIKLEIERATERRAELLHVLAEGHDAAVAAEHAEVEETIARLWDEYREARVRGRFGDRDVIIKRARLEERLARAA